MNHNQRLPFSWDRVHLYAIPNTNVISPMVVYFFDSDPFGAEGFKV